MKRSLRGGLKLLNHFMGTTAKSSKNAMAIMCITLQHGTILEVKSNHMAKMSKRNWEPWSLVHSIMQNMTVSIRSVSKSLMVQKMLLVSLSTKIPLCVRSWTKRPSTICQTIRLKLSNMAHLASTSSGSLMTTLTSASRVLTKWMRGYRKRRIRSRDTWRMVTWAHVRLERNHTQCLNSNSDDQY